LPAQLATAEESVTQPKWDDPSGSLDAAAFADPYDTSKPHAFWFWNGLLTEEELGRQLDEMEAGGVKQFFIHPRQGLGGDYGVSENDYYLSDDYFAKVEYVLKEAKKRGMNAWLYDDLNWPSGYAAGRTVNGGTVNGVTFPANPDYLPWYLTPTAADVAGGATYDADTPSIYPTGWSVEDGALVTNGGGNSAGVGILSLGTEWTNYRMEFDMTIDAVAGGFVVRAKDTNNFIMINLTSTNVLHPESQYSFTPHVYQNGAWKHVFTPIPSGITVNNGDLHHFVVEIVGDNLKIYIDGSATPAIDVTDPDFALWDAGTIGFRSDGAGGERARFDNVVVTALPSNETLFSDNFSGEWKWSMSQAPVGELVAVTALPKTSTGNCVTSNQARGTVTLDGSRAVDLFDQVSNGHLTWNAPSGDDWCLLYLAQAPLSAYHPDWAAAGTTYVDMLNPAATQKFINITHDSYYSLFGEYFGNVIPGIFNDEPGFYSDFPDGRGSGTAGNTSGDKSQGSIPWTPGFRSYLQSNLGYDIVPQLAAIWYDTGATTTKTRVDYYDALSDRYNEAHTKPLADWAADHKIALISNPLVEEDLGSHKVIEGGSWFEMSKHYQLPGMDLISNFDSGAITPKLNSSVAHLFDRKRNLAETFGAFGWTLTMSHMRQVVNWEVAGGVDLLDQHAFYYSTDGSRYNESPPSEFFQNNFWSRFSNYSTYIGRLIEPARGATAQNPVAVFYPSTSIMGTGTPYEVNGWYGNGPLGAVDDSWKKISNLLLNAQLDFDYVDELAIAGDPDLDVGITVSNGKLKMHAQEFSAVVMPVTTVMSLEALAVLEQFVMTGGQLVAVEKLPLKEAQGRDAQLLSRLQILFGTDPTAPVASTNTTLAGGTAVFLDSSSDLASTVASLIDPGVSISPASADIRVRHVTREGDHAVFVTNLSPSTTNTQVTVSVAGTPQIWDPETGETKTATSFLVNGGKTTVPLTLNSYGAVWIVFPSDSIDPASVPRGNTSNVSIEGVNESCGTVTARVVVDSPGESYVLGEYAGKTYGQNFIVSDPLTPIALDGDWTLLLEKEGATEVVGPVGSWSSVDSTFAGTGVYTTTVDVPASFLENKRVQLNLGSVKELAEISVNGSEPRYREWAPYTVDVTDLLKAGENTIQVKVRNAGQTGNVNTSSSPGLNGPVTLEPQLVVDVPLVEGTQVAGFDLSVAVSESTMAGTTMAADVHISGIAPGNLSGTLEVTELPAGWTANPVSQTYSVASNEKRVTINPSLTFDIPSTEVSGNDFWVTVKATGDDGREASVRVNVTITAAIYAAEFNTLTEANQWTRNSAMTAWTVSGGIAYSSTTTGDGYFYRNLPTPRPSLINGAVVEVRLWSSVSSGGMIYYGYRSGSYSADRKEAFTVKGGEWQTVRVTIPASNNTFYALRVDPIDAVGDVAIDYVRVLPVTTPGGATSGTVVAQPTTIGGGLGIGQAGITVIDPAAAGNTGLTDLACHTSELADLVSSVEALESTGGLDGFTADSVAALDEALAAAHKVLDDPLATQADTDAAYTAVVSAVADLVTKPTPPDQVAKCALTSLVAVAEAVDSSKYTPDSVTALNARVTAAKAVLASAAATQVQVDKAAEELAKALGDLVAKAEPKVPTETTVVVNGKQVVVTKVKFGQSSVSLVKGRTFLLHPAVYFTKGTPNYTTGVTYKSSNTKVATVDKYGRVKALKKGTARITATSKDTTAKGKKLTASYTVKVVSKKSSAKVKSVSLPKIPKTMKVGQTLWLTGSYTAGVQSVKVTYSSKVTRVVTIDAAGRLVALSKGKDVVTVKAGGKTKKYTVTVK
jgi:uncharacterized protein YjdB